MADIVETAQTRASSYRMGGPSSEYTAALLDELADIITAFRAVVERLKDANAQLQEIVNGDTAEEERIRAENEKLRAALKIARPFIGWAGHYPTILAEVDAALEGPQDRMAEPLEEKP